MKSFRKKAAAKKSEQVTPSAPIISDVVIVEDLEETPPTETHELSLPLEVSARSDDSALVESVSVSSEPEKLREGFILETPPPETSNGEIENAPPPPPKSTMKMKPKSKQPDKFHTIPSTGGAGPALTPPNKVIAVDLPSRIPGTFKTHEKFSSGGKQKKVMKKSSEVAAVEQEMKVESPTPPTMAIVFTREASLTGPPMKMSTAVAAARVVSMNKGMAETPFITEAVILDQEDPPAKIMEEANPETAEKPTVSVSSSSSCSPGKICKKVTRIALRMLSGHLGSLLLVIAYLVGGGFLFNYLEADNEVSNCKTLYARYNNSLNTYNDRFLALTMSGMNDTILQTKLMEQLQLFATEIYQLNYDPSVNCSTLGQTGHQQQWSVPGAIYFCATVITTIGYGHLAPTTMWGRVVCIVYALLGIPIMLLFLSNVGEMLAYGFRACYINFCCCRCCLRRRRIVFLPNDREVQGDITSMSRPQSSISSYSGSSENSSWSSKFRMSDSMAQLVSSRGDGKCSDELDDPSQGIPFLVEEEEEEEYLEIVNIPVTLTLGVLTAYVLIGACLFRIWESSWSLVDSTYFAFITLSTIGFGDLVPAKDGFDNDYATIEMILGAFYCLAGLSVLSMCINLIQDEIVSKFQWFGEKLGLTSATDTNEEPAVRDESNKDDHAGPVETIAIVTLTEEATAQDNALFTDSPPTVIQEERDAVAEAPPRMMKVLQVHETSAK